LGGHIGFLSPINSWVSKEIAWIRPDMTPNRRLAHAANGFDMEVGAIAIWAGLAVATAGLLVLLRPLCRRLQLVDHPDERKQHGESVPLAGGVAMLLVVLPTMLGAATLQAISFHPQWWVVLFTAVGLLFVGTVDDRVPLNAGTRMVVQISAALALVYAGGFRVETMGALGELGHFSVPFTVLVIVSFLNACNMVDGADGLLGSVLLPPLVAIALIAGAPLNWGAGMLAAVVFGFLLFNWPARSATRSRLRVFMGNGGVLFISLFTAAILIRASGRDGPLLIPLMDLATTCVRRIVHRVSPLSADRGHIHHRLLMAGLSPTQIALSYLGVSVAATLAAVMLPRMGADDFWLWTIAAAILTSATMLEIWRSTRARNRARAMVHAHLPEPCEDALARHHPVVPRAHQHPLPDKLFKRTGTGG
jgi:UDP-GlcNAc:undecaprenyl-phosphate GlcNAc-1-phosphate transferase